jgi:hypothetical protein
MQKMEPTETPELNLEYDSLKNYAEEKNGRGESV